MTLVVCGSSSEFLNWCDDNRINPHDPHKAKWIRNRMDILGFDDAHVVLYGSYYKLGQWVEIEREIEFMKSVGRIK